MSEVIIVKKIDLGVIQIVPNHEKFGDGKRPYSELPALKKYIDEGLEWFVMDHSKFPSKDGLESRQQIYHDGNEIKVDTNWEIRLMPIHLIKEKHLEFLDDKIDLELDKPSPDPIVIAKLQREKEKAQDFTEKQWYEQAMKDMDEQGVQKPVITDKLQVKIASLP